MKKKPDASLKGKKPVNKAKTKTLVYRNPSHIHNKLKRSEMYGKYLQQKRKAKDEQKKIREEQLGEDVQKPVPKTIDNTREVEPTSVLENDLEVAADEADDEFAPYFDDDVKPKILITTRPRPSQNVFYFIADLQMLIPNLEFYPRQSYSIKEICQFAMNRDYTHLIVLSAKSKVCNGLTISHLQKHHDTGLAGPTAFFKVSNVVTAKNIPKHGKATSHIPELNLHGFGTRLGHRVGRLLGSLFPHQAQFQGRQVVTFHNQRDYIFVRHHRYIFNEKKKEEKKSKEANKDEGPPVKARLQELGPRFSLKLRWVQEGIFDTLHGEYEWFHKRKEMDTSRRKFHL
ncbi:ribosome production factor 1 [Fistulifera solaris]|uniref:Ribosome production factor 1 n=1 Tax=Fistulifera solaris TaxID=1519565 RepID=A0A1Z5JSS1_FISSO|nr:ribosome production factor 1 [Fistulifera solaris]|eukprot:GAX16926.1 ribosome production factor 1 [Fistulifera solaris]